MQKGFYNRWLDFYNSIKDPSWPDCHNETQFDRLPEYIKKEIIEQHDGRQYLEIQENNIEYMRHLDPMDLAWYDSRPKITEFDKKFYIDDDFVVYYHELMDGHGTNAGQDFPALLKYFYPNKVWKNCLDWCCGAGFIGFRLLHDGLCENLIGIEKYQSAVDACNFTSKNLPSRFQNKSQHLNQSDLSGLPEGLKFDLVVANPPPARESLFQQPMFDREIYIDIGYLAHKNFFRGIRPHLTDDAVIWLQKGGDATFWEIERIIKNNGFKISKVFREKNHNHQLYYIEVIPDLG